MAYTVKIARAMSLYFITGIIVLIYVFGLVNVETRFNSLTIMAINGVNKYINTLKPYQYV